MLRPVLPLVLLCVACQSSPRPLQPQPAPSPRYGVHDLTPTFWRYWDEAQSLPEADQARLFVERVVAAHPDIYTAHVLGLDPEQPLADEIAKRWPLFLKFAGPQLPLARSLSDSIRRDLPRYDSSFRKAFPDFDYDGDVFFLVAAGAFDGATRNVRGRNSLLFGVDVIAAVYGTDADPKAFFDHELFHIYHQQDGSDPALDGTLAEPLWEEGLALYVAEQLNPGTSELVLFGLPRSSPARVRADLPRLAAELRSRLGESSRELYAQYFSGNREDQSPPARAGYTLGYLVAKELGRGRTLHTLAKLRGPELRAEIDAALRRLESAEAQ